MADIKFSEMDAAGALTGAEKIPMVQSGGNVVGTAEQLRDWMLDTDDTLAGNSDSVAPSQQAVKAFVENAIAAISTGGASIGVQFLADTASTSDADPGAGNLRWNHGTQTSATVIYIDDATFDGASLTAIWPRLNAGGVLFLQHATDQDIWQIWEFTAINDASGYAKLTVTLWAAAGTFADNDPILVTLDKGQGAGNVSSVNGASGSPIIRQALAIACSDESTALTAGTNKVKFINPYSTAFNVLAVVASLSTAQTGNGAGGILTIDINEAGASILSTKLTIDNGETNSSTAATPAVISDASIAAFAEIGIDIDQIGDGTAKGLKVYLIGYPTP